ncbi:hypothetical protein [Neobacillus drentensis]|uniref:hypothetical protein n=1 Tax=Neobacillus drentensis TaxID=220684 RepID=UPI002FFF382E
MKSILQVQEGFKDKKEALSSDYFKIYRSKTRISALKFYVGKASNYIGKSTTIPHEFHSELSRFQGIVSIGRTKVKREQTTDYDFKNIHLYSSNCETLDGYERICYVYGVENKQFLKIKECARSRGDNYSAYYKLLSERMMAEGFIEDDNEFVITKENVAKFISIVNKICKEAEIGLYEQHFTNEIQNVNGNYFNTFYWSEHSKENDVVESKPEKLTTLHSDFNLIYQQLFNLIDSSSDIDLLSKLGKQLRELGQFAELKANLKKPQI